MRDVVLLILLGLAICAAAVSLLHRSRPIADAASAAMLQAMERGYHCHAAGRALVDCQQEQRQRWANPDNLPPFGSRP